MSIRIIKQFLPDEYERIRRMAVQRQRSKDAYGIHDGRMIANGIDAHVLGLAGEFAVAELFGGALDARTRLGGDDGAPDIELPNGETINVKTRREAGYSFLLTPGHTQLGADYGVLCWTLKQTPAHPLAVEIVGIISDADFDQACERMEFGHGPRIGVRPQVMRKVVKP
jgi:hypothetical protein